jgi:hypothetical protein
MLLRVVGVSLSMTPTQLKQSGEWVTASWSGLADYKGDEFIALYR